MNKDDKWILFYSYAKNFYEKNGHLNIPVDYKVKGLRSWVSYQRRKNQSKSPLTDEQVELLNKINYMWDIREEKWQYKFSLAKKYFEKYGHINIPQGYMIDGIDMGRWIEYQRQSYFGKVKKSNITKEHIELLEEHNIKWNYLEDNWEYFYEQASKYYHEHGNLEDISDKTLKHWVQNQRNASKNYGTYVNGISIKRKELLDNIGMRWGNREKIDLFDRDYPILLEYYKEFGTVNIPIFEVYKDKNIGKIVYSVRKKYRNQLLTDEQIKKMNELGIIWDPNKNAWDTYYGLLEDYYLEHGDSDVPQYYETDGYKLGEWVKIQRQAIKGIYLNKITEEQIDRLNQLDFKWNMTIYRKENSYSIYKEYYDEYGTLNVPYGKKYKGINLGHIINNKRYAYMSGKIRILDEDILFFNRYDFDWSPNNTKLLNSTIVPLNKEEYYNSLNERVNHILSDLVLEGTNEINQENQKEIEKVIIKRLFR